MRSALFVSPNFLERAAEPESPFHPVYLTYRKGEITRAELIARLPHVAMLGDSACMGICISWPWSTLWRARMSRGKNWFLHLDAAPSICSISKGLEAITPFVAIECAGLVRSWMMNMAVKIFFDAISQAKSVSWCEHAGFPI
jgi:hypothetical protein